MGGTTYGYPIPVCLPAQKCEPLQLMASPLELLIGTNSSSCGATNSK